MDLLPPREIFGRRLRVVREREGLSQRALGVEAGLNPSIASTRINRYEKGVHEPDMATVAALANVLNVDRAYFYCVDDRLAQFLLLFSRLSRKSQTDTLARLL